MHQRLTFGITRSLEACMTRAVVFLTTTMLLASLGAVAQNNSPGGGASASVQATAPSQNAQPAAPPSTPAQSPTTAAPRKGIESSAQNGSQQDKGSKEDPRTASSAELPQTSTILPLLGLLGLGSLVAGLFARR
jgi:hypothetical protein